MGDARVNRVVVGVDWFGMGCQVNFDYTRINGDRASGGVFWLALVAEPQYHYRSLSGLQL
jgi:hypothetical protein